MKSLLIALSVSLGALFLSSQAQAATRLIFMPIGGGQVHIMIQEAVGQRMDDDPHKLYDSMSIPPQDGMGGGKGKLIKLDDQSFVFTCVERESMKVSYMCQITLKASSYTRISAANQTAELALTGELADRFRQSFVLDGQQSFSFVSEDEMFSVDAQPGQFHIKARGR
jgi:hypothetical protein